MICVQNRSITNTWGVTSQFSKLSRGAGQGRWYDAGSLPSMEVDFMHVTKSHERYHGTTNEETAPKQVLIPLARTGMLGFDEGTETD